ncbi:hypothetical protein IAU59_001508 [Kwoniella sp. CBS 9459]
MPLPFFLQPLLLVVHYWNRLTQRLTGWLQRSNEQLFGPLEQAVAAVVIVCLAMRAPPAFLGPPALPAPVIPPIIINGTAQPPPAPPPPAGQSVPPPPRGPLEIGEDLSSGFNPINIVIALLLLNLVGMMVPEEQKRRLKESWDLFWPPWQDRSGSAYAPPARTDSSRVLFEEQKSAGSVPRLGSKSESEKARETKKAVEEAVKDSSRSSSGVDAQKREAEPPLARAHSEGKPSVSSASTDSKDKKKEDEKPSSSKTSQSTSISRSSTAPEETEPKSASERSKDDDLNSATKTDAERARTSKSSSSLSPSEAQGDKGKSRMEGERPETPKTVSRTESEKARQAKKDAKADPKMKSAMKESTKAQQEAETSSKRPEDTGRSKSDSGTEIDDVLMAGDYRPLKSALKKSKKKPRQHKNIHHNYFMTMRGWRPALIPFPHGYHPKPHYPRNTLWWDNVPRNADHIMAPPPIPKEPKKSDDEDDERDKGKKESKKKEDNKDKQSKKDDKASEKATSPAGEKNDDAAKDKEKDKAKLKAEAEAKAKAKAKQEAEAKAATLSRASSISSGESSPAPSRPPVVSASPQVQKATYISQALLSVLLFYVNPQLGLLLLTFFVWQFINTHNEAASKILAGKQPPPSGPVARAATGEVPSSPARGPVRVAADREDAEPRARATSADVRKPTSGRAAVDTPASGEMQSSIKPSTATPSGPTEAERLKEVENVIKKLKALPELTPELKEKLERARVKRKQLMDKMTTTSNSEAKPSTSSKGETKISAKPTKSTSEDKVGTKLSVEELENKAKEMDDYVRKMSAMEELTDEQKAKMKKAEERRRVLWKEVRSMQSSESDRVTSKDGGKGSDEIATRKARGSETANPAMLSAGSHTKLKDQLKEIEAYVMKYRKIADPTDEQKEKLLRAESKRSALKKELQAVSGQSGVGGSGLSAMDKGDMYR